MRTKTKVNKGKCVGFLILGILTMFLAICFLNQYIESKNTFYLFLFIVENICSTFYWFDLRRELENET